MASLTVQDRDKVEYSASKDLDSGVVIWHATRIELVPASEVTVIKAAAIEDTLQTL